MSHEGPNFEYHPANSEPAVQEIPVVEANERELSVEEEAALLRKEIIALVATHIEQSGPLGQVAEHFQHLNRDGRLVFSNRPDGVPVRWVNGPGTVMQYMSDRTVNPDFTVISDYIENARGMARIDYSLDNPEYFGWRESDSDELGISGNKMSVEVESQNGLPSFVELRLSANHLKPNGKQVRSWEDPEYRRASYAKATIEPQESVSWLKMLKARLEDLMENQEQHPDQV